jgi:hypothetical protein
MIASPGAAVRRSLLIVDRLLGIDVETAIHLDDKQHSGG